MQRRTAVLFLLLGCAYGLAGCGGTSGVSAGPSIDTTVQPTTTTEAMAPTPSTTEVAVPEEVPVTEAPPATAAPRTTEPRPVPTTPVTEPPVPITAPEPPGGTGCDPSYPSVCIPPPLPDLDCADVAFRRFTVVGADPHRFDADHDGIGCESG